MAHGEDTSPEDTAGGSRPPTRPGFAASSVHAAAERLAKRLVHSMSNWSLLSSTDGSYICRSHRSKHCFVSGSHSYSQGDSRCPSSVQRSRQYCSQSAWQRPCMHITTPESACAGESLMGMGGAHLNLGYLYSHISVR